MLTRPLVSLLIAANTAYSLKNTSPFFLLSTQPIKSDSLQSSQLATASTLENGLISALGSCDASLYVFIEQPGVRASDLRDGSTMPQMQRRISHEDYKSVVQIPEVMGELQAERVRDLLSERCEAKENRPEVRNLRFPVIMDNDPEKARRDMLQDTDAFLAKEFPSLLSNYTSHVLIFTSNLASAEQDYETEHVEMDEPPFHENLHPDLKRGLSQGARKRQASNDDDFQNGLPLFEKYQFLSPGIFMGLSVSLLLLIILYVGISAISGLQVSYMAFSKEMGPQAQKKQQ